MPVAEAARHPKVVEHVQDIVTRANQAVSRAESIRAFEILDVDWTEASGHLTPSMKIKRARIAQDFADRIEEIYSRAAPDPAAAPVTPAERIKEKLSHAHLPGSG